MSEKKPQFQPLATTYKVSLDFLGESWKDAYIELKDLPWGKARQLRQDSAKAGESDVSEEESEAIIIGAIQEAFVSGRVPSTDGSLVDIPAEYVTADYFSLEMLSLLFNYVVGAQVPKASMRLSGSSPVNSKPQTT